MLQYLLWDGRLSQEISGKHCLLSQVHGCPVLGIEAEGQSSPWTSNRGVLGETVSVLCVSGRRDTVCVSGVANSGMEHVPGVILTRYIAVWRFVCACGGRDGLRVL